MACPAGDVYDEPFSGGEVRVSGQAGTDRDGVRDGGLLQSTAVVGGFTMLSRLLGFVRDVVLAKYFGANAAMDAFFVAFKIPNFMRRLFAEGSFAQAFVPVFSEYRTQHEREELQQLADQVAGTLGAVLMLVTVIGVLGAPLLIAVFAPGFIERSGQYHLAVSLLRVTFPYLLFISLTAFAGGMLNSYGRFGVPAFTPVLLNVSMISAAVWLAPHFRQPVHALALGILIAGVAQLTFQLPFLARLRLLPRPRWGWHHPGVARIMRLMVPTLFGSSVAQVNLLVDTLIASFLAAGSVSWLYYSDRLMEFPLGVFGIAMATVILPNLSRRHAANDAERFSATLDWALRLVLLVGVPAALGLLLLSGPVLTTLFFSRAFDPHDVYMAAASLVAYAGGLVGFMLVRILLSGYYARQDTRTPVRIGMISMATNIGLNLVVVVPLAVAGAPAPHAGLAASTSFAAFVNAALLYRGLRRARVYRPGRGWPLMFARVALAGSAMSALLIWGVPATGQWMRWATLIRVRDLAGWIAAGGGLYVGVLWLTGIRPSHLRGPVGQ